MTITSPAPTGFPVPELPARRARAFAPARTGRWRRLVAGNAEDPRWARSALLSLLTATGLLYINVGSIASGTILAAGHYFGAGLLV